MDFSKIKKIRCYTSDENYFDVESKKFSIIQIGYSHVVFTDITVKYDLIVYGKRTIELFGCVLCSTDEHKKMEYMLNYSKCHPDLDWPQIIEQLDPDAQTRKQEDTERRLESVEKIQTYLATHRLDLHAGDIVVNTKDSEENIYFNINTNFNKTKPNETNDWNKDDEDNEEIEEECDSCEEEDAEEEEEENGDEEEETEDEAEETTTHAPMPVSDEQYIKKIYNVTVAWMLFMSFVSTAMLITQFVSARALCSKF